MLYHFETFAAKTRSLSSWLLVLAWRCTICSRSCSVGSPQM